MKQATVAKAKLDHYVFLCIIVLIGSVSFFATDIYVPALPEMAEYFHCNQVDIQSSFTLFFLGLALCQLVSGALSDRFGRKKILLVGFCMFTFASWGCAQSKTLSEFLVFRLLQAISGGVGSVVFRALIVDRFSKEESAKLFSVIFPIIGLSAAIAPLIGGYLTYFWGWKATFSFVTGFGAVILVLVSLFLDDKQKVRTKDIDLVLPPPSRIRRYFGIVRNAEFLGYTLVICACFCAFRSYTVESPFVFNHQGYAAEEIGQFYIILSVNYLLGSLLARTLMNKIKVGTVLWVGIGVFVTGGFSMIWASWFYSHSPFAIILPMSVIALGNGLLFPIASAGALTSVPGELSGSAAGLMGATQFVLAAFCINWVGELCGGQAIPLSFFMGVIVMVGLLSYWLFIHRPSQALVAAED